MLQEPVSYPMALFSAESEPWCNKNMQMLCICVCHRAKLYVMQVTQTYSNCHCMLVPTLSGGLVKPHGLELRPFIESTKVAWLRSLFSEFQFNSLKDTLLILL